MEDGNKQVNLRRGINLVAPSNFGKVNSKNDISECENEMNKTLLQTKRTNPTLMSYSCTLCDYVTKYKNNFKEHNEIVHLKIRHKCDQCGVELTQKRHLRKHKMSVHSTARPFICEVCSDSFKSNQNLKSHMEYIHSLQRHVCKHCGKIYNNNDALKAHNRYHDENLQLKCELCGKGFVSRQKLKEHMNTHTGKKPYICLIESCSAAFASTSSLSHHKKSCLLQKG